jgi:hypothetical protein
MGEKEQPRILPNLFCFSLCVICFTSEDFEILPKNTIPSTEMYVCLLLPYIGRISYWSIYGAQK